MLATALSLAALLSQHTGYTWSALSAERVSCTLPSGWECSVWTADSTTASALELASQFIRTYAN